MNTSLSLIRRMEDLEAAHDALQRVYRDAQGRDPREQQKRWTYIVETVEDPDATPTYPTTGDTFNVRFIDIEWEKTVPSSGFTKKPRSAHKQVIAKTVDGEHLEKGTIALCTYQPPPPGTEDKGKWVIHSAAKKTSDIVFFKLTANLSCGGQAQAKIQEWDATAGEWVDGATITVKDEYGDLHAKIGYKGYAIPRKVKEGTGGESPIGADLYSIIYVDHQAIFIEFTLDAALAYSGGYWQANANLTAYYQGQNPVTDEQTQIVVYDPQEFFPRTRNGAKGKAVWSQCEQKYVIYECQQMARVLKAKLVSAMCPEDPFGDITNVTNVDFSPFNLNPDPAPTTGGNATYSLAGEANNEVWLEWDHAFGGYQIIQVRHKKVKLLKNIRYNEETCQVEGLKAEVVVMTCKPIPEDASQEWESLIQLQAHDYLSDARLVHVPTGYEEAGSCVIEADYKTVCGFGTPIFNGSFPVATFTKQQVVIDVWKDAHYSKIYETMVDLWVPCIGADSYNLVADLTYCCGETVTPSSCCCGLTEADTLKITFSDGEGRLACLDGKEYTLVWDAGLTRWKISGDPSTCVGETSFTVLEVTCVCTDGVTSMTLNVATSGDFFNYLGGPESISCEPTPSFTGTALVNHFPGPTAKTIRWTVTKV